MFDLIAIGNRNTFHDRTLLPTAVSVMGHVVVVSAVLVLPWLVAVNRLPAVPDMMAFTVPAPAPPAPPAAPPPPPTLGPAAASQAPVASETAPKPGAVMFPVEAPPEIRVEDPGEGSEGVAGGVEGGVVGGVVGGIVGGFAPALPPPPPPPPPVAAAPPGPPARVRIGGLIQAPALVHRVEPEYPPMAMHAQVAGIVILEAVVDAEGRVESVQVLQSVKLLDRAAIDAVKQWRYSPLMLNGIPTPFVISVTLSFSLRSR